MHLFLVGGSTDLYKAVLIRITLRKSSSPILSRDNSRSLASLSATCYLIQLLEGLILVVKNSCLERRSFSSGEGCTIWIEAVM